MRKLKIIRTKSFVGCLLKAKIYMACNDGDYMINGIKCKQIISLKNGKEAELEISNDNVVLIVLGDKIIKEQSNDKILILEGSDDVVITVSCVLNWGFQFDEGIENTQKI